jgi:hypothetical protein
MSPILRAMYILVGAIGTCAVAVALLAIVLGVKEIVEHVIDRLCGPGEVDDDDHDDGSAGSAEPDPLLKKAIEIAHNKDDDFWTHVTDAMNDTEGETSDPPDGGHLD